MHIHGPIEPMLAKSIDQMPAPRPGAWLYEVKLDGYRAIARIDDRHTVQITSRRGVRLDEAFPEVVAALYGLMPAGTILDGELVRWNNARLDFSSLQRRYANRRRAASLARTEPCHYAIFDVLESARDGDLRRRKLTSRRRVLERFLRKNPPGSPLALVLQTADAETATLWCETLGAAGCEGLVIKPADGLYLPGSRGGWLKYKTRSTTEAIIGGVTGRLRRPESLILGRYDAHSGLLRVVGRTTHLTDAAAAQVGPTLTRAGPEHPWPTQLTLTWRRAPTHYLRVDPAVVVEVSADVAVDAGRWRHAVRYVRVRDIPPDEVPTNLDREK